MFPKNLDYGDTEDAVSRSPEARVLQSQLDTQRDDINRLTELVLVLSQTIEAMIAKQDMPGTQPKTPLKAFPRLY